MLSSFKAFDSNCCNFIRCLLGVVLLNFLCDLGLVLVLTDHARRKDCAGQDQVYLDVLGVEQNLLLDAFGQAAHGILGGSVWSVSRRRIAGADAPSHDEVLGLLLDRHIDGKPLAHNSMRHLSCAPEVDVHMVSHGFHFHIDEQLGVGQSSKSPDDIGGLAIVPGDDLGEERLRVGLDTDVGSDIVKALGFGVFGSGLYVSNQYVFVTTARKQRTLTVKRAASSLLVLRETRTTFAPLAESWVATLRPAPSDAPVMRIV